MSITSEITDLESYLSNAYSKVNEKGGTIPLNKNAQNLASTIDSIPTSSIIIIPPEAGTLTSISVTNNPNKTTYTEGEYFDFAGLIITATYSSGQQFDVTNSCTYTMNQPLQVSDTSILVTYESQTTTISIVVNAIPVPAPASTTALFHFDQNLNNACGGSATTGTTPNYVAGKFDKAITTYNSFEMNIAGIDNQTLRINNYTFEFWAKCSATGTYDNIRYTNKYYTSSHTIERIFSTDDIATNGLKLLTGNKALAETCVVDNIPSNFSKTDWNHIAIVFYSDGTYKAFLNGTLACHGNTRNYQPVVWGGITTYSQTTGQTATLDEFLFCTSAKYTNNFVPNHAPYYLQ